MRTPIAPVLVLLVPLASCARGDEGRGLKEGRWRAALESPGGEIPFEMRLAREPDGALVAFVINGPEEIRVPRLEVDGRRVTFGFDHLDSTLRGGIASDGSIRGEWTKTHHEGAVIRMDWHAEPGDAERFGAPVPEGDDAVTDVTGEWSVWFEGDGDRYPSRGVFEQKGDSVTGTFLTPTGDYRYLAGDFRSGVLRLSCFDGAHAFLVVARAGDDGTLAGDLWSRNTGHETWTARRAPPDEDVLPDPYAETTLVNPDGRFRFSFPDLEGNLVSWDDPRFEGKVVLVEIFGSWCPNCNDAAPVLAELHRKYGERGLEIVGLAFEMTGDPERDRRFLRRYGERYGVRYPLLLAGTSVKADASLRVPDLSGVKSFPTLIFIGRDGLVKHIFTGFSGPGTGERFEALRVGYRQRIEALL